MSEATPQNQEVKVETPENTPVERTDIELRAMDMGWRPREEFDGSEDDFIDAKEFVRRKPLFEKIETQSRETKQLRKAIEALQQHYTQREEAAVKIAIKQLQEARKQAITDSDGERFDEVDAEIKRAEAEAARLKDLQVKQEAPELHPDFVEWANRNKWYTETGYMRKWADDYGTQLANQGMNPHEVLKQVEKAVRKEFANKFTNPNKENAPAVENSGGGGQGGKSSNKVVLTPNEERVMKTLVSTGTMTKEQYMAQITKMREAE